MARKVKRPLRPMHTLSKRQQAERRFARKAGFKDEYEYRKWVRKQRSLPESRIDFLRPNLRGDRRLSEIARIRKLIRQSKTPAGAILRKAQLLVWEKESLTPFEFLHLYGALIKRLIDDETTTEQEKKKLQDLYRRLQRQITAPQEMRPGQQGVLF